MTLVEAPATQTETLTRRVTLVGVLELACQELDLTPTQYERARERYENAGKWIATSQDVRLRSANIYPQGSVSTETLNRPVYGDEADIDSVNNLPIVTPVTHPVLVKQLIGDRLRDNTYYASIMEEKPRCWRLNYKGEFHLDITPSISNPRCSRGGELVPDRDLKCWKPSNPKGFTALFIKRSELPPSVRLEKLAAAGARASIETLPTPSRFKGFLKRTVQLQKRHRDVYFQVTPKLKPISVIVTTLAARSYEYCVTNFEYDTEFDLLLAVIDHMPRFIEVNVVNGYQTYAVWNETTDGENFAEKWNQDGRLAKAFYSWHSELSRDLRLLLTVTGIDEMTKTLGRALGGAVAGGVRNRWAESISKARASNSLAVVIGSGLATAVTDRSVPVRQNIFHGR
jgi:hypothetical protein